MPHIDDLQANGGDGRPQRERTYLPRDEAIATIHQIRERYGGRARAQNVAREAELLHELQRINAQNALLDQANQLNESEEEPDGDDMDE